MARGGGDGNAHDSSGSRLAGARAGFSRLELSPGSPSNKSELLRSPSNGHRAVILLCAVHLVDTPYCVL